MAMPCASGSQNRRAKKSELDHANCWLTQSQKELEIKTTRMVTVILELKSHQVCGKFRALHSQCRKQQIV